MLSRICAPRPLAHPGWHSLALCGRAIQDTLSSATMQSLAVPADLGVARLSVEQYHAMIAAGILHSGDPVELLPPLE